MKKQIRCLGIIMLMMVMAGCQTTPESVKDKTENYIPSEDVEKTDISYVNIEHLLDNQEQVLEKEYQNIQLLDTIQIEQPDEVCVLSMKLCEGFATEEKVKKIISAFFQKDDYEEKIKNYKEEEWASGNVLGFHVNTEKDRAILQDDGFCCLCREKQSVFVENLSSIYHIDWKDKYGDCVLNGKKRSIDEAVKDVNDWCNENWKLMEPNYFYQVKNVYKCKDKTGDFLFFEVCKNYRGIPFEDINFMAENEESYFNSILEVTMREEGIISGIRNNNFCYEIESEQNHSDKLIGLGEALQIVEQKMAGSHINEIIDIDIKYEIKWIGDKEKESVNTPGTKFEARPVWSLIIDAPKYQSANGQWARKFINVDMVTGEVMYQDVCLEYD